MRREEIKYEKDIVEKCEEEPKLFYKNIKGKMTSKETVNKIEKDGRKYEDAEETSEIMNECFKSRFYVEEIFWSQEEVRQEGLQEVKMKKQKNWKVARRVRWQESNGAG